MVVVNLILGYDEELVVAVFVCLIWNSTSIEILFIRLL